MGPYSLVQPEIPAWPRAAQATCSPEFSPASRGNSARRIGPASLRSAWICTGVQRISPSTVRTLPACLPGKSPMPCRKRAIASFRSFVTMSESPASRSTAAVEVVTQSAEETIAWGREFAKTLRAPVLVALSGDLGTGKTTLTKGIISGLGAAAEEDVTSPTFTLVHVFHNHSKVYHVDLYRVEQFRDLETLGIEDVLTESAIVIIEWAERFSLVNDWPQVQVRLDHLEGDARRIVITD